MWKAVLMLREKYLAPLLEEIDHAGADIANRTALRAFRELLCMSKLTFFSRADDAPFSTPKLLEWGPKLDEYLRGLKAGRETGTKA